MLYKIKINIRFLFIILTSILVIGCQSLPKNVGVSSSSAVIGLVYKAKLIAIYPIFVKQKVSSSARDGAAGLAEVLTEHAFSFTSSASNIAEMSSNFAEAATGMYEDRYAGLYCHYILEVDGKELINTLSVRSSSRVSTSRTSSRSTSRSREDEDDEDEDDEDDEDEDEDDDDDEEARDDRRQSTSVGSSRRVTSRQRVDTRVEYSMNDLWSKVEQNLGDWPGVTNIQRSNVKSEASNIFVVNPCRNFRIGSMISVSKGSGEIILQPSW